VKEKPRPASTRRGSRLLLSGPITPHDLETPVTTACHWLFLFVVPSPPVEFFFCKAIRFSGGGEGKGPDPAPGEQLKSGWIILQPAGALRNITSSVMM